VVNISGHPIQIVEGDILGDAMLCSDEILDIAVDFSDLNNQTFENSDSDSLPDLIPIEEDSDSDFFFSPFFPTFPSEETTESLARLFSQVQAGQGVEPEIAFADAHSHASEDISPSQLYARTETPDTRTDNFEDTSDVNTDEGNVQGKSPYSHTVEILYTSSFPSRTVEVLQNIPSDKSFVKPELHVLNSKQGLSLKEDEEGWLSLSQTSKSQLDSEFSLKLQRCIGSDLTPLQQTKLIKLLFLNKQLFGEKQGVTSLISHTIENSNVVFSKPRKLSQAENDHADKLTAAMLKDGVIRTSSSPYNSPIIMVTKKDGSIRFCVDYRRLNKVTKTCKYPLTYASSCYDKLHESYYFTSLDFQSAYWSIPMAEEDKEKTAFTVRSGKFEFNVMPFGLSNAVATFCHLMDKLFAVYQWNFLLCFIDDCLIFTKKNFSLHLSQL